MLCQLEFQCMYLIYNVALSNPTNCFFVLVMICNQWLYFVIKQFDSLFKKN